MRTIMAVLIAGVLAGSGAARAQEAQADSNRKVRDQLASMRITLDFNNARLDEVVAYFQEFSGLNFHIAPDALAKQDESRITIRLKEVPLKTALKLILRPRDLGCVYKDGVLVIAPKSQLQTDTITRVYEARDLMQGILEFAGPRMELTSPGSGQPLAGAVFFEVEEPKVTLPSDVLLNLVKANTGGITWEDGANSITEVNGLLIVSQSKAVHDEVRRLLDQLRQYK